MKAKQDIKIKVYIDTLERNPYCYEYKGQSQIYTCHIGIEIDHHTFNFSLVSGYKYTIDTGNFEINDYRLKNFTTIVKYLSKHLKKYSDQTKDHSYLSLDRHYQINAFWSLLKDLDFDISYQENKTKLDQFRSIEDIASKKAIELKLVESSASA